jgi:hypothetical protein
VRSKKGSGHNVKIKHDLKLKIGHFPRRNKMKLSKSRNQRRREREELVAIFVMKRGTLLLHA